ALPDLLQFTGQGIVLSIPYPLYNYRYVIAWKPIVTQSVSTKVTRFREQAESAGFGNQLATTYLESFRGSRWEDYVTWAIYVPETGAGNNNRFLRRVGFAAGSLAQKAEESPPHTVDLANTSGLYRRAWWNQSPLAV